MDHASIILRIIGSQKNSLARQPSAKLKFGRVWARARARARARTSQKN